MNHDITDQLGRSVSVPESPRRIVSLCPSITESLFALGLSDRIVGRTRYCTLPESTVDSVQTVGGTKDVEVEAVLSLHPDLVLAEKEENTAEVVEGLEGDVAVFVFDVRSVDDALQMLTKLGMLCDRSEEAGNLRGEAESSLNEVHAIERRSVLYLVWREPFMAAGADTFVHSLLTRFGLENVCTNTPAGACMRYPVLSLDEMRRLRPQVVLLPDEPYAFRDEHAAEIAACLPDSEILLIDGRLCWYGARMAHSPQILQDEVLAKLR